MKYTQTKNAYKAIMSIHFNAKKHINDTEGTEDNIVHYEII